MATYSRDALAGPLRRLEAVIGSVRSGDFDPDATRSGYITRQAEGTTEATEPEPPAVDVSDAERSSESDPGSVQTEISEAESEASL
eukprot:5325155-Amphidinium_carterae.1